MTRQTVGAYIWHLDSVDTEGRLCFHFEEVFIVRLTARCCLAGTNHLCCCMLRIGLKQVGGKGSQSVKADPLKQSDVTGYLFLPSVCGSHTVTPSSMPCFVSGFTNIPRQLYKVAEPWCLCWHFASVVCLFILISSVLTGKPSNCVTLLILHNQYINIKLKIILWSQLSVELCVSTLFPTLSLLRSPLFRSPGLLCEIIDSEEMSLLKMENRGPQSHKRQPWTL